MKRLYLTLALMACTFSAHAQVDEFRAAFDSFRQQARREYDDFRSKANAEYAEWLEQAWKEYKALPAIPKPKDDVTPPVVIKEEDKAAPIEDKPVVIEEEIKIPAPLPQPMPIAPIREQPQPEPKEEPAEEPIEEEEAADKPVVAPSPKAPTVSFSLYGTPMEVRADASLRFTLPSVKEKAIASQWKKLSAPDYNNLIRDCLALRLRHNLCDWAYLRMLDTMASTLLGQGTNEATLLKAFVFCQSGYQMRLATEGDKLLMLYACQAAIIEKVSWQLDGTSFYIDGTSASESISICNAKYPHEQALSLDITKELSLSAKPAQERTLQSEDKDWMTATAVEDENLMSFFDGYPSSYSSGDFMTRWALYANVPVHSATRDMLYPQLRAWIEGKSEAEAVDILCHWIQTAFVYEYDNKVWGHDRAFFADETLYYPYCDCEDRSILLTRLVRDLLGLKCALVYYPGHLATAIAVGEEAKGDFFRIGDVKFLVCDPTYIGAPIGRAMSGMDGKKAKVIVLD